MFLLIYDSSFFLTQLFARHISFCYHKISYHAQHELYNYTIQRRDNRCRHYNRDASGDGIRSASQKNGFFGFAYFSRCCETDYRRRAGNVRGRIEISDGNINPGMDFDCCRSCFRNNGTHQIYWIDVLGAGACPFPGARRWSFGYFIRRVPDPCCNMTAALS